jgi:hypothetical protein
MSLRAGAREPCNPCRIRRTEVNVYARRVIAIRDGSRVISVEGALITFVLGQLIVQTSLPTAGGQTVVQTVPGPDVISHLAPFDGPRDLASQGLD